MQITLVTLLVAAAAAYIGWRAYRTWRGGCGTGCAGGGCGEKPGAGAGLIAAEELLSRVRRRGAGKG